MKAAFEAKKIDSLRALNAHVLVTDMHFGERTLNSGIILLGDDKKRNVNCAITQTV